MIYISAKIQGHVDRDTIGYPYLTKCTDMEKWWDLWGFVILTNGFVLQIRKTRNNILEKISWQQRRNFWISWLLHSVYTLKKEISVTFLYAYWQNLKIFQYNEKYQKNIFDASKTCGSFYNEILKIWDTLYFSTGQNIPNRKKFLRSPIFI